jgi:hypothetical protein
VTTQTTQAALELRVICGLLATAARLVPIPFLDDILRERATQLLVSRTLKAHGRKYASMFVAPLYGDDRGCAEGCLIALVIWPIKLILYPFRKVITWILAAKNLATDVTEAVLLGRTLQRCLEAGRLAGDSDTPALRAEAALIKKAFRNASAGTDLGFMRGVLGAALRSVSGLPGAALRALRKMRKKGDDGDPNVKLEGAEREKLEDGANKVAAALDTPEMRAYLEKFDAKFDENMAVLKARGV